MNEETQSHRERAEDALAHAATAPLYDQANALRLSAIAELLLSVDDRLAELAKTSAPARLEISYGDMRASLGNGGAA